MSDDDSIKKGDSMKDTTKMTADGDALEKMLAHVGDMGRYQKLLILGMCPFGVLFSFVYFVQMFITLTPQNHWCRVPELGDLSPELRRNLSVPRVGEDWDKCAMFAANWTRVLETLTPPPASTPTTSCLHGWEFDLTDIPFHTVVTERGWVCEFSSYAPTAQTAFFAGSFFGVIFFGWLGDAHGRVPALVGATSMALIGGVATIFTTGFLDFTFCRIITGLSYDSIFMLTYILTLEYIGPRYRTLVANTSLAVYFGGGCLILPWLSLWLADWRALLWVTAGPLILIVVVPYTVPESARWLLTKGRVNDAVKLLRKFERINRKTIPQDELDDFIVSSRLTRPTGESIASLLRSRPLRRMVACLVLLYMMLAVVFDALVRMSDGLGLDVFLAFTLTSATEIPSIAVVVLFLDKWGRRILTVWPMVISGFVVLLGMFVPKGVPLVCTAVLARFLINMSFTASVQWSTELLPTSVRAAGSSLIHVSSFISVMFSPFVVYSSRLWSPLPFLILTVLSLGSASIGFTLPETLGKPLPQTFADAEKVIREYSMCGKAEESGDVELQCRQQQTSLIT